VFCHRLVIRMLIRRFRVKKLLMCFHNHSEKEQKKKTSTTNLLHGLCECSCTSLFICSHLRAGFLVPSNHYLIRP
jgi:hypothetical protein